MKTLSISIISLLIAVFAFCEDKKQTEPFKQRPQVKPDNPGKPPAQKRFPLHWGKPPEIQLRDYRLLPGGFGMGSSTLANWIAENLKKDAKKKKGGKKPVKPVDGQNPKPIPPIQPIQPEAPKEIKEKIELHKKIQDSLRKGLKEKIDGLGEGATKEEIKKVVAVYKKVNADRIQDAAHIGKQVHEWQKENRPERPKRPEPSEEVRERLAKVKLINNDLSLARKVLSQELEGKSKEGAAELIKEFKQSQKERQQELKEAKKELAKEVRGIIQTKDRRE